MKRFLIKVIVYFCITALLCFLPSMIVDPFSVFHPLHARSNGIEPNKNYIKMYYVLHNPDKFDTFVMGSSHVQVIDVTRLSDKGYNLYYSGGLPSENLANLKTLVRHRIYPKHIYVGVDDISLDASYEDHSQENLRAQYEYSVQHPLKFWMMYLDPVVNLVRASDVIRESGKGVFNPIEESFYRNSVGYIYGDMNAIPREEAEIEVHRTYADMMEYLSMMKNYPLQSEHSESVVSSIGEMRRICDRYGIELTVFVNPMYFARFADTVKNDAFLSVLRQLAQVTPYYNFCGYNKYTTDSSFYFGDRSHYNTSMTDLMIDAFAFDTVDAEALSQGFGQYVTEENVEDLIALITNPSASW